MVVFSGSAKGRRAGETIQLSDAKGVAVTEIPSAKNNSQWQLHLETHTGARHLLAIEYDRVRAEQIAEVINPSLLPS